MALAGQRFLRFLGLTALWAEGCGGGFAAIYSRSASRPGFRGFRRFKGGAASPQVVACWRRQVV